MKKLFLLSTAAILLAGCLAGCAEHDEKFVGNWEASKMVCNGTTITELAGVPIGAMMRFELKSDGSANWMSPIESVNDPSEDGVNAKWKSTDENNAELKVSVPNQEDNEMELEYRDGKIVINTDGVETYLEKVDEFSEVDADMLNDKIRSGFNLGSAIGG